MRIAILNYVKLQQLVTTYNCNLYICRKLINMKNTIDLEKKDLEKIRSIAVANDLPTTNQSLVNLAVSISTSIIQHLDAESFEQITSFKL